jgi:hypothetical protein
MNIWVTTLVVAIAMLIAFSIAWKLKDREP